MLRSVLQGYFPPKGLEIGENTREKHLKKKIRPGPTLLQLFNNFVYEKNIFLIEIILLTYLNFKNFGQMSTNVYYIPK